MGRWWPVRIAGVWILLGGMLKSLTGLPSDLPVPVLSLDLDPLLVLVAASGVEVLVGTVGLLAPRLGWMPVSGLLGLFLLILAGHWWEGGGSCGCFGTAMALPPWLMLAMDAVMLGGALVSARLNRTCLSKSQPTSQPDNRDRGESCLSNPVFDGVAKGALAIGVALAVIAAGVADRRLVPLRPVETVTAVAPPSVVAPPPPKTWSMPTDVPEQVLLRPSQWVGKPLSETEFGRWVDVSAFPADARMIIYYESCNHCADHLRELAAAQEAAPGDPTTYILAQLPTPKGYKGRLHVDRVPKAAVHVVLPDVVKAYVITPPWDVYLEGGRVARAERVKWGGEKG